MNEIYRTYIDVLQCEPNIVNVLYRIMVADMREEGGCNSYYGSIGRFIALN
mgnify:CR=1 FL=1